MTRLQRGVIEIVCRIVCHAEPVHNGDRPSVHGSGEAHDLRQAVILEARFKRTQSCLGREALFPRGSGEPPTNLNGWGKLCVELGTLSPTNPMNTCVSTRSMAQSPNLCLTNPASIRSTKMSLATRSSRPGKYRITSGSAFISAKGSRSSGRHRRINNLAVRTHRP
jgi:hypothetical protein